MEEISLERLKDLLKVIYMVSNGTKTLPNILIICHLACFLIGSVSPAQEGRKMGILATIKI